MYIFLKQLYIFIIFFIIFKKKIKTKHKKSVDKKNKNLYLLYSVSSFFYTVLGLFMLKYPIKFKYFQNFYPYFMIIQGFISYISDVIYADKTSIFHNIDRGFATYNTIICIILAFKYKLSYEFITIILTITAHFVGNYFINKKKIQLRMLTHFFWHLLMPLQTMIVLYRHQK